MKFDELKKALEVLKNKEIVAIHIDYDNPLSVNTFRGLRKAIMLFGGDNVEIIKTSSGAGIQLRVYLPEPISPVEAIVLYHYLESDPWRTSFIVRRMLANPRSPTVDVSFLKKRYPDRYSGSISTLEDLKQILLIEDEEEAYNKYVEYLSKVLTEITVLLIELPIDKYEEFKEKFKLYKFRYVLSPRDTIVIKLKLLNKELLEEVLNWLKENKILYKVMRSNVKDLDA